MRSDRIIRQFCELRDVDIDHILSSDKHQDICHERGMLMLALNKLTRMNQTQIGHKLNRERSTVSYAIIQTQRLLDSGKSDVQWFMDFCDKMREDFVKDIRQTRERQTNHPTQGTPCNS